MGRFLSHGGRLQLIKSVIASLTNFWIQAFRLPSSCLKEIERFCSAFLWSGPELKTSKAKVSWKDVCLPKQEGGVGAQAAKRSKRGSWFKTTLEDSLCAQLALGSMGALLSDQEGIILVDKRKYNIWIMGLAKATETP